MLTVEQKLIAVKNEILEWEKRKYVLGLQYRAFKALDNKAGLGAIEGEMVKIEFMLDFFGKEIDELNESATGLEENLQEKKHAD